jgi:Fe2+ transport system protein FeoA
VISYSKLDKNKNTTVKSERKHEGEERRYMEMGMEKKTLASKNHEEYGGIYIEQQQPPPPSSVSSFHFRW